MTKIRNLVFLLLTIISIDATRQYIIVTVDFTMTGPVPSRLTLFVDGIERSKKTPLAETSGTTITYIPSRQLKGKHKVKVIGDSFFGPLIKEQTITIK